MEKQKFDFMRYWPMVIGILGAVWYAGHLDARINGMESSINSKLDALTQTLETRQNYDEREILEIKDRENTGY